MTRRFDFNRVFGYIPGNTRRWFKQRLVFLPRTRSRFRRFFAGAFWCLQMKEGASQQLRFVKN
jgi:hypothetical protein